MDTVTSRQMGMFPKPPAVSEEIFCIVPLRGPKEQDLTLKRQVVTRSKKAA